VARLPRYQEGSVDSQWRAIVKARADYTCEICKVKRSALFLDAHHLASYSDNPHLRTDINNSAVLCRKCHMAFHDRYGRGENTKQQYEEFKKIYKPKLSSKVFKKPKIRKFKVKARHAIKPSNHN